IVAGSCFIIPAAILVTAIAAAYVRYGHLPRVGGVLYGVKPVVVAVIVQAFWKLARSAVKGTWLVVIGLLAAILCAREVNNLLVLVAAAVLAVIPIFWNKLKRGGLSALLPPGAVKWKLTAWLLGAGIGAAVVPFS